MNESEAPLWKRVLFYRISEVDRPAVRAAWRCVVWAFPTFVGLAQKWAGLGRRTVQACQRLARFLWPGFGVSRRCGALGARRIDHWWTRWLVSLTVVAAGAALVATNIPAITLTWLPLAFEISSLVFASALCAYFAWLLFFRLQCSLLEWCGIIMLLGNAEGLLVTTPGFAGMRTAWGLAPLVAAWVLYGAVKGLTWAGIMDVTTTGRRAALLVAGWLSLAAPAMILAGVALLAGRAVRGLISRDMAAWGVPFIVVGAVGMLLRYWVERRAAQSARAFLDSADAARKA